MRRSNFTSAAVAFAIATVGVLDGDAAQPQSETARPKEGIARPGGGQSPGTASPEARDFINEMAIAGLAEVQLGEMALSSKQS